MGYCQFLCRIVLLCAGTLCVAAGQAAGQTERLRQQDDQFIQGLREAGMPELFGRFVARAEAEGGLGPVAQRQLQITLHEFAAADLFQQALEQHGADPERAQALFLESRDAYESLLDAQRLLIEAHPDDERVPIWEIDLAAMLLETYLPTYFDHAIWFYDYGVPTLEQAEAFERSVVQAFELAADARHRVELLPGRLAADHGGLLRGKLEAMNIFFALRHEYAQRRVPYWYAHAAYYVALLPESHPYYRGLGLNPKVRHQAGTAGAERLRLLGQAELIAAGGLQDDAGVGQAVRLLGGRALVRAGDIDRADEGVDVYLEPVITASADRWEGFLASLAKARGRAVAGELDVATDILVGMQRHRFVAQELRTGNTTPRLIVADLLHRLLRQSAEGAPGADREALLARAYETPYLQLVEDDPAGFYGPLLFRRWAERVGPDQDPAALPPMVRMGIGQRLTQRGGGVAEELVFLAQNAPLTPATDAAQRSAEQHRRAALLAQARADLSTAARYNQALASGPADDTLKARGLMNLGLNRYLLAELGKYCDGLTEPAPYFEAAQAWARIGTELPDTEQAEQATGYAVSLLQQFDQSANTGPGGVTHTEFRAAYRDAVGVMYRYWPASDAAHAMRVYTGFFVYELSGDLVQAIEIYRGVPPGHPDYYEARRQMVLAMQKVYRQHADGLRQAELTGPANPSDAARQAHERELDQRRELMGRQRRGLMETAELLLIDAEDELDQGSEDRRRFSAATAAGAARVVNAAMASDGGETDTALGLLEGYEDDFIPSGALAPLVAAQPDPDAARQQLDGLIQSAQERRILTLVESDRLDQIGDAAHAMIRRYPDAASGVVNGVLQRIEGQIGGYEQVRDGALLEVNQADAQRQIARLAGVATQLSELLVGWAQDQGYTGTRLLPFELGLARALLLAGRADEAAPIMAPWLEAYPNNFEVAMLTADCRVAAARQRGDKSVQALNPALDLYYKIILYYNSQPGEKPRRFWVAWLKALQALDYVGGGTAEQIPEKIRMLQNRVSEDLGGPDFQPRFMDLLNDHLK